MAQNQYFETIPTYAGNAAPPGSVRGSGNASADPHALAHLGHDSSADARPARLDTEGQATDALASSTALIPVLAAMNGSDSAAAKSAASQGGSVVSAVADAPAVSDSGGLGVLLPLLLATALIAAICVAAARPFAAGGGQIPVGPDADLREWVR